MTWRSVSEARERLSRENGTIRKDWGGKTSVALAYPNSYYLGMSSLGFQTVYGILNSYDNIVCERVFRENRRDSAAQPISLESQRPLTDFDVLAFSVSYELDYLNIVRVLRESRIPLLAADRDESHPFVIAGGPCVTANPEPLSEFVECFAVGEAEAILPAMLEVLTEGIQGRRAELLDELGSLPGVYAPMARGPAPVERQWLADLDSTITHSVILTPDTDLSDMFTVEIARGCGRCCRFCLAGFWFRPFRHRALDVLLRQAKQGLERSRRIGLLAAAVSDHPDIDDLATGLSRMGAEISVSSLRIRPLSKVLARSLAESGTQTATLAPEAGSERLRELVNKGVTEDDIVEAIDVIAESGIRHIKLYFMIGLPTETDHDVDEIVRIAVRLKRRVERTGCRIALAVEPFVPKAGTPFQRLPMAKQGILEERLRRVRGGLAGSGIELRAGSVGWSMVQGVLSRGDARVGTALADMPGDTLAAWRRALEERGLRADRYLHRELPSDEAFPWYVVDSGVASAYLEKELEKALRGEKTQPCTPGDCHTCGVC